ncbi:MAG: ATP-dependent DNA helicase, partial [Candidatus Nanopelagicales bacterium]
VRLERRPSAPAAPLELDDDQRAVVEHRGGHLLVLAGPGTGKTATLAELVVRRIADRVDPVPAEAILALTFGRRAARELSDRISRRLAGGRVPVVSTFHAFAYGVLRQHSDPTAFASPPRLLTAPEQEARLRELLGWAVAEGRVQWPESLAGALGTRGIAEQVRALLARARGLGLGGDGLARIGRRAGIGAWAALGPFFEEYLDTLGFEGSLDYAELIHRAAVLARDPRAGRSLREAYRLIVVDEYQDTDPAQVRLLRGLAAGGAQVVAVGDPDQAIYGFRGGDVGGILRFPEEFHGVRGEPARIIVLRRSRRFPAELADATKGLLRQVSLAPLPAQAQRLHRTPLALDGPAQLDVLAFPSAASETSGVAEALLRAHAGADGREPLGWSQMGVLVRNPAVDGPRLARAIRGAGIPIAVPPSDTPLGLEPAVQALLLAVATAMDPDGAPADTGRHLLLGPLGRGDAIAVRALARDMLRAASQGATSSDALLTAAIGRGEPMPASLGGSRSGRAVAAAWARVARAVASARAAIESGEHVGDVLWAVWDATDWPSRLQAAAVHDGASAAAANRDLDAMVALFEMANGLASQQRGAVGVGAFLTEVRSLNLPVASREESADGRDVVQLLSAHRAKGLEWELVVVAAVQEGRWPDVRLRSDLLQVAELGIGGRVDPATYTDLLAEERRLMYVACTRARSRLIVTAVAEPTDGGDQPSRFLPELGRPVTLMPTRSAHPMAADELITALRRAASAPEVRLGLPDLEVERLRGAAVARLAALSGLAGGPPAPGSFRPGATSLADPSRWWYTRPVTGMSPGDGQIQPSPLVLSASAVTALLRCPLQWFLDRRVGAGGPSGAAAVMGSVVHAVAEAIAVGGVPADPGPIADFVDSIWAQMPFPARYQRERERERVDEMIAALLAWHAASDRTVVAAELPFQVKVQGLPGPVELRGTIDRVEADPAGRVHVVDFKTGRTIATAAEAAGHPQLGVYQLAVRGGTGGGGVLAGAELVHLGDTYASGMPKVRVQAPLPPADPTWIHDLIAEAARLAAGPEYPARPHGRCGTCAYRFMCPAGDGHSPARGAGSGAPDDLPTRPADRGGSR